MGLLCKRKSVSLLTNPYALVFWNDVEQGQVNDDDDDLTNVLVEEVLAFGQVDNVALDLAVPASKGGPSSSYLNLTPVNIRHPDDEAVETTVVAIEHEA